MLADRRIVFLDLDLFRMQALVLGCGVEMPGSCGRHQSDFVSHNLFLIQCRQQQAESTSDLLATRAQIVDNFLDAEFVDNTHSLGRHLQADKTFLAFQPETMLVQIGQKPSFRVVFGMGNIVPADRSFASDLTYSGHGLESLF